MAPAMNLDSNKMTHQSKLNDMKQTRTVRTESVDMVVLNILVGAKDAAHAPDRIMTILQENSATINFLDSRSPRKDKEAIEMEFLLSCQVPKKHQTNLVETLEAAIGFAKIICEEMKEKEIQEEKIEDKENYLEEDKLDSGRSSISPEDSLMQNEHDQKWFPRHVSDLDKCTHLQTKFEPEMDMNHPGWNDAEYRSRRKVIADVSFNYKHGDRIPNIEYTADDIATWDAVYNKVKSLIPGRASSIYSRNLQIMEKECGFRTGRIPQLEEVSSFLKRTSGFSLRPAAGLITPRDFLASLAFRVFQCTQYVRHPTSPHYSPEPDVIHELIGHTPMFADPAFAQFCQELGLASLGGTDAEIDRLATLFWFTVEFGLCKEGGETRAYGAGLLSSTGELLHSLSGSPSILHKPFDPVSASVQAYDDQDYQDVYFVAESFEDAKQRLREWVATCLTRRFTVRYLPYTQSVQVLHSIQSTQNFIQDVKSQVNQVCGVYDYLLKLHTNANQMTSSSV